MWVRKVDKEYVFEHLRGLNLAVWAWEVHRDSHDSTTKICVFRESAYLTLLNGPLGPYL